MSDVLTLKLENVSKGYRCEVFWVVRVVFFGFFFLLLLLLFLMTS